MTTRDGWEIPYESQPEAGSNRMCGAAALSMVYRSLAASRAAGGAPTRDDVSQDGIWQHISKPNASGGLSCSTHLMVKDALRRGYAAVAIQAEYPLQALLTCGAHGIRAILNHRVRLDGPAGHFTVLVGMDPEGVIVHDPQAGPSQRVPFGRLLELWQPRFPGAEIVGNVLIGIADRPPRIEECVACSSPIPAEQPCPKCKSPVPLAPAALIGCVSQSCVKRNWLRVCCPSCDYTFPLRAPSPEAGEAAPRTGPVFGNLGSLYAELDKFQAYIRSLPEAAGREDVQLQLASLEETKEKMRLAEHEELARMRAEGETRAERAAALEKEKERIRKEQEAAATAAGPLDGDALTARLLADLGLVK